MRTRLRIFVQVLAFLSAGAALRATPISVPTSTPITTASVAKAATDVLPSVFRVTNYGIGKQGTGFLHKSGTVITAAHVVRGATPSQIKIRDFAGSEYSVTRIIVDEKIDIALLLPSPRIVGPIPLTLAERDVKTPGRPIEVWGYPGGYGGGAAMLVVGYVSAIDDNVPLETGGAVTRMLVNAAFNSGNSGGPIIDIESGQVIGVVSAKLAPIPPEIVSALEALKQQQSGAVFNRSKDGVQEQISEAQVVAMVLDFLRNQTQLVVGHASLITEVRDFLRKNGIAP